MVTRSFPAPIILFALILLVFFFYLISDLVVGLLLGFIVATLSIKLYDGFLRLTKRRESLAAAISVAAIFLIVVIPLTGTGFLVASDLGGYLDPEGKLIQDFLPAIESLWNQVVAEEQIEVLGVPVNVTDIGEKVQQAATKAVKIMISLFTRSFSNLAGFLLTLVTFLYSLYFGYRDGRRFLRWLIDVLPFEDSRTRELLDQFHSTSLAIFKGTMAIGIVQGGLGGLLLWATGVPTPFLWTVVMVLLSIIPGLGVQIILLPAGIGLILSGHTISGVIVLATSLLVIGTADNLLRPILIGRGTSMHELLIFVSTVGGLLVLGAPGLIIGPIVAALLRTSLRYYQEAKTEHSV